MKKLLFIMAVMLSMFTFIDAQMMMTKKTSN